MVNKTNKESLNNDGQQFHQYQQNKQGKSKQRWSEISSISTVDIGRIVDHHSLNFSCLFC
jgi:hypothetical protein